MSGDGGACGSIGSSRRFLALLHGDSDDGRRIQDDELQYYPDAGGRPTLIFDAATNRWLTLVLDGDGWQVKRVVTVYNPISTTYYLRSTVLDGRVITELNQNGQKTKGYVFAGGQLLAAQQANAVTWQFENPLTGSRGRASADGSFYRQAETDPTGVNLGFSDPFAGATEPGSEPSVGRLLGHSASCGLTPDCTLCNLENGKDRSRAGGR
jgi:hypothetical protein